MKISIITLGIAIAFVAGSTLLSSCGSGTQKDTETQEQHAMEITAKASCPMHPEITGKEDDKCSKCGMTLVLNDTEDPKDGEHTHQN
ncbi:MAG: hypothetical protein L3J06_03805 [Cyclobacteriaceae bacterium]|nr:hypothetical protein [Cyclobacteriaceae bacterium]